MPISMKLFRSLGPLLLAGCSLASAYARNPATEISCVTGKTVESTKKLTSAGAWVNVNDFGARGNPGDDTAAFQNAINALPVAGGRIDVPGNAYVLNRLLDFGAKSIFWNFGPGVTFTGAGTGQNKFPSMHTNGGQMAAGPWIYSQSRVPYKLDNGGVAALNVEMIQPSDVNGQSVALYTGARGASPAGNVWAMNPLIQADKAAGGTYQGIEVDANNFSTKALVKGISINGVGTVNPQVGLEVMRTGTGEGALWKNGINIRNADVGIKIEPTASVNKGIVIGSAVQLSNTPMSAQQGINGGDTILLQRASDIAPVGQALRIVNAANTATVAQIDVSGNIKANLVASSNIVVTAAAIPAQAGSLSIGASTVASAKPGDAGAAPAEVSAYLVVYIGKRQYKIPLYD